MVVCVNWEHPCAGKKQDEDSPLMKEDDFKRQRSPDSMELSPSPPETSPLHVQFSPGDHGQAASDYHTIEDGKEKDSWQ